MRDEELTELLRAGVDADDPPPERVAQFTSSLRERLDAELADRTADRSDRGGETTGEPTAVEIPPETPPGTTRGRWWVRGGLAVAAAAILIVVVVVAGRDSDSGDDADTVAAGPLYDAAVLPDAVVQDGDPGIVLGDDAGGLDELFAGGYTEQRAAYEAAGFEEGLAVDFTQDLPLRYEPGLSLAHRFGDQQGAAEALAVLEDWHVDRPNGVFGLASGSYVRRAELDLDVGDQAVAFVMALDTTNPLPKSGQGVVLLWRTGNVVHLVRAKHAFGDDAAIAGLVEVAEAIDARMPA